MTVLVCNERAPLRFSGNAGSTCTEVSQVLDELAGERAVAIDGRRPLTCQVPGVRDGTWQVAPVVDVASPLRQPASGSYMGDTDGDPVEILTG